MKTAPITQTAKIRSEFRLFLIEFERAIHSISFHIVNASRFIFMALAAIIFVASIMYFIVTAYQNFFVIIKLMAPVAGYFIFIITLKTLGVKLDKRWEE